MPSANWRVPLPLFVSRLVPVKAEVTERVSPETIVVVAFPSRAKVWIEPLPPRMVPLLIDNVDPKMLFKLSVPWLRRAVPV